MPDLESKIAEWRKRMAAGGVKTPAVLDELEGHLREEHRARLSAGASETEAFQFAVARIGEPTSVRKEFDKIKRPWSITVTGVGSALWLALVIYSIVFVLRNELNGRFKPLWSAHVFTTAIAYFAAWLVGFFGMCYIGWRSLGKLTAERSRLLRRAMLRFISLCAAFVFAGTISALFWLKQNRGGYWTGGTREIAGLCAAFWFVGLWALQYFKQFSDRALALFCIIGNMIVNIAWFDPRLNRSWDHRLLGTFLGIQLVFLLMAFSRKFENAEA